MIAKKLRKPSSREPLTSRNAELLVGCCQLETVLARSSPMSWNIATAYNAYALYFQFHESLLQCFVQRLEESPVCYDGATSSKTHHVYGEDQHRVVRD
jgi:hypothetical protein